MRASWTVEHESVRAVVGTVAGGDLPGDDLSSLTYMGPAGHFQSRFIGVITCIGPSAAHQGCVLVGSPCGAWAGSVTVLMPCSGGKECQASSCVVCECTRRRLA